MSQKLKIISMINLRYYLVKFNGREYILDFNNPKKLSSYGNYNQKTWKLYSTENVDFKTREVSPIIRNLKKLDYTFAGFLAFILATNKNGLVKITSFDNIIRQTVISLIINLIVFLIGYTLLNRKQNYDDIPNLKLVKEISIDNHISKIMMNIIYVFFISLSLGTYIWGVCLAKVGFFMFFSICIPLAILFDPIIRICELFDTFKVYTGYKKQKISLTLISGLVLLLLWILYIIFQVPEGKLGSICFSFLFLGCALLFTFFKKHFKEIGFSFYEGKMSILQFMAFIFFVLYLVYLFIY